MGKLKNGKAAGKDEVTGEMIKGGGNRVVDWGDVIWLLRKVYIPLYKGKGESTQL